MSESCFSILVLQPNAVNVWKIDYVIRTLENVKFPPSELNWNGMTAIYVFHYFDGKKLISCVSQGHAHTQWIQ